MSSFESAWQSWLVAIVSSVTILVTTLYVYATYQYRYWNRRGVPFIVPNFPLGNVADMLLLRTTIAEGYTKFYNELQTHPYGGIFHVLRQTIVLRDPEVIKQFLIKDFGHFHDRGITVNVKKDPLSARLFFLNGDKWKRLRNILTPTFTSGKIKMMFETIGQCAVQMEECVRDAAKSGEDVEIKDITARYTTDVIASCAFGIECNCLRDPEAEFRQRGRELLKPSWVTSVAVAITFVAPVLNEWLRFGTTGTPKYLEEFFTSTVTETMAYREKNNVTRMDFMQMMIQLKNYGYVGSSGSLMGQGNIHSPLKEKVSESQVVAQTFGFFLAGFETSSSTISYCLYELSLHQDIQKKLREEILRVVDQHGGKVTYESVADMEYLDRVLSETLRKYPPIPIINRECTEPYRIPGTDVVLEVGTPVVVPTYALHHDSTLYPDPERFDPERFTIQEKQERHACTYLPFGAGPRNCLGMRFGLIQTKLGLISIIRNFQFKLSAKTPSVLEFDPKILFLAPKTGIHLQITEVSENKHR